MLTLYKYYESQITQKYINPEISLETKRIMKKIGVMLLVFFLLFAISSAADVDTGFSCSLGCDTLAQNGDRYYCNQDTQTCFQMQTAEAVPTENATAPASPTTPAAPTTEQKIATLEQNLASLQQSLQEVNSGVSLSSQDIAAIKNQLAGLEVDIANLKGNLQSELSTQTNSLATGLAGLQSGVNQTQQTLNQVQESLTQRQALNLFLIIALIVTAIGSGLVYYMMHKQHHSSSEIASYVNDSIKQGKKLPQIKAELRKNGWTDTEIETAYKETASQNYQRYKSAQPEAKSSAQASTEAHESKASSKSTTLASDPRKMIIIAVVSILLIGGVLLVLRGVSTGQAIFFQKLVGGQENGTAGEITYKVDCTPPHLLNPTGDACCLDSDHSGVCDTTEMQGKGLAEGGECNDNRECKVGLYCIANKCNTLNSLYTGEGDCSKLCSYYAVKVITSDGESYDLKPKQGSYTGAGALEWKILEMPQYCKWEKAVVPINIIKKQTGKILSEEVITLHEGESSELLTHPTVSKLAFRLTVDRVFESCPK